MVRGWVVRWHLFRRRELHRSDRVIRARYPLIDVRDVEARYVGDLDIEPSRSSRGCVSKDTIEEGTAPRVLLGIWWTIFHNVLQSCHSAFYS